MGPAYRLVSMIRMATAPGVCGQSAIVIRHRGIVRVDRLDEPEPPGMGRMHLHRIAGIVAVQAERRHKRAPSTPTASIASTIASPVTCSGQFGTLCQGRFGVFA